MYQIVKSINADNTAEGVRALLSKGYELHGTLQITQIGPNTWTYTQAMVKQQVKPKATHNFNGTVVEQTEWSDGTITWNEINTDRLVATIYPDKERGAK